MFLPLLAYLRTLRKTYVIISELSVERREAIE